MSNKAQQEGNSAVKRVIVEPLSASQALLSISHRKLVLGSSIDVPVPSILADHEGIKRGSGQHLVAHRVGLTTPRASDAHHPPEAIALTTCATSYPPLVHYPSNRP